MVLKLAAILTTFLLLAVQSGAGLKCTDVIGDKKPRTMDCEGSCASSRTLIDGESTYAATCIPMKMKDRCMEVDGSDVCYCNQDMCNTPKPPAKPISEIFSGGASGLFSSSATSSNATYTVTWLLFIAVVMGIACTKYCATITF